MHTFKKRLNKFRRTFLEKCYIVAKTRTVKIIPLTVFAALLFFSLYLTSVHHGNLDSPS